MNHYGNIELAIVEALAPILKPLGVEVKALPQNPGEFRKITKGAEVTVGYVGSEYGPIDAGNQSQDETVTLNLLVQGKNLRDNQEAVYKVIRLIQMKLIGLKIKSCFPITLRSAKFSDLQDTVWVFEQLIDVRMVVTADPDLDTGPLITGITFTETDTP